MNCGCDQLDYEMWNYSNFKKQWHCVPDASRAALSHFLIVTPPPRKSALPETHIQCAGDSPSSAADASDLFCWQTEKR